MNRWMKTGWPLLLGLTLVFAGAVYASVEKRRSGERMASAARNFLVSLSDEQRAKAFFPFASDERLNWHYIPKSNRKGLPFREMDPGQAQLANAFITSGLSSHGYEKATAIMSLESLVKAADLKAGNAAIAAMRGGDLYFIKIFGEPSADAPWGWSFEGHHISLNFTIVDGRMIAGGPTFFGSNPHEILEGPRRGLRPLADEEDLGRALLASLDDAQRARAILPGDPPRDILTEASRKAQIDGPPQGLPSSAMGAPQRERLTALISEYIDNLPEDLAAERRARVEKADPEKLFFAWMGGTVKAPGTGTYYRVQGTTFLIEYDNTQHNANHSHAVWRDFDGDFGLDLLAEHYKQDHKK